MSDVILSVEDLTIGYPHQPPVLVRQSFGIERGARVALLGANGAGKSTLLHTLAAAHTPTTGVVKRSGEVVREDRASVREHRRHVQLVLQDPDDQLFSADVTQDISFGPMNMGLDEAEVRARVDEALELLGIPHLAARPTHQLSGGERKRVAAAGAVAMRPSVLMLDEPTAGLDSLGTAQMLQTLEGLHETGSTIVVSTHDVDLVLGWADRVLVIHDAEITSAPAKDALADDALMTSAHLKRPWLLEIAFRLGFDARPRTIDDLVSLMQEQRS